MLEVVHNPGCIQGRGRRDWKRKDTKKVIIVQRECSQMDDFRAFYPKALTCCQSARETLPARTRFSRHQKKHHGELGFYLLVDSINILHLLSATAFSSLVHLHQMPRVDREAISFSQFVLAGQSPVQPASTALFWHGGSAPPPPGFVSSASVSNVPQ
jgi:hypothetical protein